ncbi:Nucleic-acid-binding protein transposon like protein [Argiope bruennichi]|uniref:Nucleic-acid-binding protein transposon like protein n=1 Tax=Argiope bruennichi TaxID=94029 RepID=A0A8T0F2Y0_ARGBR|nr:Nucleic-acid-binding protein transposon like protein [Argiope bruennichi]
MFPLIAYGFSIWSPNGEDVCGESSVFDGAGAVLRVISPKKPAIPRAQTPLTGLFQDQCGKGDQGSSSEEEIMEIQTCQAIINENQDQPKLQRSKGRHHHHQSKSRMIISPSTASSTTSNVSKNNAKSNVKTTPKKKIDLSGNVINKNQTSPKGSKERKKRVADEDGFIAPVAHLIRKVKNLKINNDKNEEIKTKKLPEGIEEVVLDNEVDAEIPPAQPKRRRVPPFFVTPRADFRTMLNILKLEAPSLRSVISNKFLKITVETEEEHRSLSHLLEAQGAEFKTFMLKTDRPIKVVLRGLLSCTPIEEIKAELQKEGFTVVSITQLSKFQTKSPMPLFYAQIANGPLSETVYTLTEMFGTKISMERYRGRKGPSQCWRCQGFFDSSEKERFSTLSTEMFGHENSNGADTEEGRGLSMLAVSGLLRQL